MTDFPRKTILQFSPFVHLMTVVRTITLKTHTKIELAFWQISKMKEFAKTKKKYEVSNHVEL